MIKVLIYEEYDAGLHGNQTYTCHLLGEAGKDKASRVRYRLVVPSAGALYRKAVSLGDVIALGKVGFWGRAKRIFAIIKTDRPDIVHCNNVRSLLMVLPASMAWRIPIIWYIKDFHGLFPADLICFLAAKRILTIAPQCLEAKNPWLVKTAGSKIYHLPIGVPTDEFLNIERPCCDDKLLRVLMLAAVAKLKGIDIMLEALERLDKSGVPIEVRVAGTTPKGEEQFARKMRSKSEAFARVRVRWLGWRPDVKELISESDVVALTSRTEGVPRSLVEAMEAGRPVVASRVGGIPSIVRHGENGLLFRVGDSLALAECLRRMALEPEMRLGMGRNARESMKDRFDLSKNIEALFAHYEEVARTV